MIRECPGICQRGKCTGKVDVQIPDNFLIIYPIVEVILPIGFLQIIHG